MIKFSIVMITYNHMDFISHAIDSVIRQTFKNWELIIVDDGSIDETQDIISRYDDKRIKSIFQSNKGIEFLAESYNTALDLCSGDYICILEGDDSWYDNKLEVQAKAIERCNFKPDLIWARTDYINEKNEVIGKSNVRVTKSNGDINDLVSDGILYGNIVTPSPTVVFNKDTLISISGFQNILGVKVVDYPTALKILFLNGKYLFIDEYIASYRRHTNQATQTISSTLYREHNIALLDVFDIHKLNYSNLIPAIIWNDLLFDYSIYGYKSLFKYIPYCFKFDFTHNKKFFALIFIGGVGKSNLLKLREFVRRFGM